MKKVFAASGLVSVLCCWPCSWISHGLPQLVRGRAQNMVTEESRTSMRMTGGASSGRVPDFVERLGNYGRSVCNIVWDDDSAKKLYINIVVDLCSATVRWWWPEFARDMKNLWAVLCYGLADLSYDCFGGYHRIWGSSDTIRHVFNQTDQRERFLKNLKDVILLDRGLERKKLKSAYDNDKGFYEIFRVNVKDQSIDVGRVVCSVQNQTGFVKGGVNEVNGNIRSENNELKIRFSDVYAQILLMKFLNTPEKLWNWLTGKGTPPDSYPKSKELKEALDYSDGGFYLTGSGNEIPIFSGRSSFDAVREALMKPETFRTIRDAARRTYLKDGFEIKIQRERSTPAISIDYRVTAEVHDMRDIVKPFHGDDKWRRVDEEIFNDRWYITRYSTASLVEIYAKRWSNSNLFYNWTTSYQGGGWKLGHDFRESERHSDFDDIQKLINGDMPSGRIIDSNSNFVFHNFLVMVQEALQLRTDVSVQFDVFYNGWGHNKYRTWFGEGNNPWL